jgi:hypothetical protein
MKIRKKNIIEIRGKESLFIMSEINVETESEILRGLKTSDSLKITSSRNGAIMATNRINNHKCSFHFSGTTNVSSTGRTKKA